MKKFKIISVKVEEGLLAEFDKVVKYDKTNRNRALTDLMEGSVEAWRGDLSEKKVIPRSEVIPNNVQPKVIPKEEGYTEMQARGIVERYYRSHPDPDLTSKLKEKQIKELMGNSLLIQYYT